MRKMCIRDSFKTVFDEQDDLMDFGEDYEPIRDFFGSEQLTIFTRALDLSLIHISKQSFYYIRRYKT